MGTSCSKMAEGTQYTDDVPTKTGAAPWINGWWYLFQPTTSHRTLRGQSRDWWSVEPKHEKYNFFSFPTYALWFTSIPRNLWHFSITCRLYTPNKSELWVGSNPPICSLLLCPKIWRGVLGACFRFVLEVWWKVVAAVYHHQFSHASKA